MMSIVMPVLLFIVLKLVLVRVSASKAERASEGVAHIESQ